MKLIVVNIKKVLNANFLFMTLTSLIFGFFMLVGNNEQLDMFNVPYYSFVLKGFIFIFIVFALELSKNLLQEDKLGKKIEWFLGNGVSIRKVSMINSISLYLGTSLLLLPLTIWTGLKLNDFQLVGLLDYYLFAFVCSIIINRSIMFIVDMNRFKGIIIWLTFFYLLSLILEMFVLSLGTKYLMGLSLKYLLSLLLIGALISRTDKERITSAYY